VFGANVFTGAFSAEQFSGFNPNYQIAIGDRINLRLWGAFTYESVAVVDAEGNIFIPNVGPVRVLGVRNSDLNGHIEAKIKAVYLSNVGVYATLDAAQPVKVYVTGFVRRPGLYGGSSWDSVLYYLDKAGGIDPARGSYRDVTVQRGGKVRAQIDLYPFLLKGSMKPLQLADGDTIVVGPRKHVITVSGEVLNPYQFEFTSPSERAAYVLSLAKPKPNATHINIARRTGIESRNEYYALDELANLRVDDGDEILVTADKYPGTILVRVEGANLSERSLILPYGARLRDAIERIRPAPQANMEAIQLFRKSLALRQKEMLDSSLRRMEAYVLTARSATSEEAALRAREADLVLQFIERARSIQPKGQIVLGSRPEAGDTLLEDGDTIKIPERTVLVSVHGEVSFPNTVVFDPNLSIEDYIRQAGGYTQKADTARLLVMHQDGTFAESDAEAIRAGDEILVLPKVESKNVEVTRGITQIIYQIAIAAKVAFGL
jgi:protein involved in polysaccharide export with SLBB domain